MSKTLGPSPGALKYPDHIVKISPENAYWTVTVDGTRVAGSSDALLVEETGYERVVYFPSRDVNTELLDVSESRTTCPFKGEAHYLASNVEGMSQDVGWFYPSAYNEVEAIAGYVAFYSDRVTVARAEHSA